MVFDFLKQELDLQEYQAIQIQTRSSSVKWNNILLRESRDHCERLTNIEFEFAKEDFSHADERRKFAK